MRIRIEGKFKDNLHPSSVLQQTAFWSKVKEKQGIHSRAFRIRIPAEDFYGPEYSGGNVEDDILILFQNAGDGHLIGYAPYGPKIEPAEDQFGPFLEELSESLRPRLPRDCVLLRYDLRWHSLWNTDGSFFNEDGDWQGPPRKRNQELRMNFSTTNWNLKKANTDILPSDTVFVDLQRNDGEMLSKMRAKTRYNIRLSGRKGVRVYQGDPEQLELWYELYRETCERNGIRLHHIDHFRTLVQTASACGQQASKVRLLIAEAESRPLAAMFLALSGRRATYLYGASSSAMRSYMPAYALQWQAMIRAREQGCTEYDMFGISPSPNPSHPLYGLYRFKTGFGGSQFHRMGCWDYPLDNEWYGAYLSAEMKDPGYHL